MRSALVRNPTVWLFAFLVALAPLTIVHGVYGWSEASRMGLTKALVEQGTLSIENTPFNTTGDKVFIDGHFYSDKLALPSLLAAVVYAPLHWVGIELVHRPSIAYIMIVLVVMKGTWLAGLGAFHHSLRHTDLPDGRRVWVTAALGVSSLFLTWSATFNNHALAAGWIAIGMAALIGLRSGPPTRGKLALAGLMFGMAGASDMPTLAVGAVFGLWLAVRRERWTDLLWYFLPLGVGLAPSLVVNYVISGSLVPVQLVESYFLWPGSPWSRELLSGAGVRTGADLVEYAWTALLGARGFLWMNPLLVPALWSAAQHLRPRSDWFGFATCVWVATGVIVAYYLLTSANYGGGAYGIRWWVPPLPLWYFFLADWLARGGRLRWALFGALFVAGVALALIGVLDPWARAAPEDSPVLFNLNNLDAVLAYWRRPLS